MKKYLLCLSVLLCSCGESGNTINVSGFRELAENHVLELKTPTLLQEFILSMDNDTNGVCYALVIPKQSLIRLMTEETYATPGGLEKMQEGLIKRYVLGRSYIDSCISDKFGDKDWLINNTVNEPVNPIWEQIAHE